MYFTAGQNRHKGNENQGLYKKLQNCKNYLKALLASGIKDLWICLKTITLNQVNK
jgi:hypothetical protein